jgi:hypothetical protein
VHPSVVTEDGGELGREAEIEEPDELREDEREDALLEVVDELIADSVLE